MDNVKGRILLKQQISNLKEVEFEDIERQVNVMQAHIDGGDYNQFYINYFISYTRDGEGNFILLPAFDYIMGVFDSLNAISYDVLKAYIVENDNDGKWDLTA